MLTEQQMLIAEVAFTSGQSNGYASAKGLEPEISVDDWLADPELQIELSEALSNIPALTLEELTSFASPDDEFIDNGIDPATLGPHGQYYVDASLELTRRKAYSKSACAQLIAEARLRGEREGPALTYTTEPRTDDGYFWIRHKDVGRPGWIEWLEVGHLRHGCEWAGPLSEPKP